MFIKSSNKLLNFFLFILSSISIIGALSLIPTDFASITKSMFWVLVFLIVLTYSFIKSKSLRKIVLNLRRWIIFISIILTFCWQFILVKTLSGNTWWDTSIVAQAASGQKNWLGMMYFSYYPNTFYLFRFEKFIFEAFNLGNFKELTTVLNNINIIVLDLSFVFLINAVKRIFKKKKVTYLVGFFSWILIVLSPYVVIFYSDTLGFFVSSLILYILSFLFDNRSIIKTYCLYIVLGVLSVIGYFIKPSLVIVYIALTIVGILSIVIKYISVRKNIKFFVAFLLSLGISFSFLQYYQHHNEIYNIDSRMTMPMSHFIVMGMTEKGGYDPQNTKENFDVKDPKKRNQMNIESAAKKLNEMGLTNYLKFLVIKQSNNTSDATFGWRNEAQGVGFLIPFENYHDYFMNKIQKIFTSSESGQNWKGYALLNQLIWVIVLIGLILSLPLKELKVQFFKYTVIGGMIFLLIFEGGRSRYLIQFLPYIFILASLGITNAINVVISKKN
ncbi:hypothetical protein ACWKST_07535 [Limosilactobacillus reuteri]